jgi:riboflavin synthase
MFTGIIECLGRVLAIQNQATGQLRLRISPSHRQQQHQQQQQRQHQVNHSPPSLPNHQDQYAVGDSIAVNGVCLTIEKYNHDYNNGCAWFEAYASQETLLHTNLRHLKTAQLVNLERALALGQRLGGHWVSGHIDTIARVKQVIMQGSSQHIQLAFPQNYSSYFVTKGSIALDGVSLTINKCTSNVLEVNVIPHTRATTTIAHWHVGYCANLEIDIISKHLNKHINKHLNLRNYQYANTKLQFQLQP